MPPPARDASTIILVRDSPAGIQALLVQRHLKSKFAGGFYAFPGGQVEEADLFAEVEDFCQGLSFRKAVRLMPDITPPERALGCWVGGIREVFEEVGILLAYQKGGPLVTLQGEEGDGLRAYREAFRDKRMTFLEMLQKERLRLATDRLFYFAHWVTPEESSIRFDTRFFVAVTPPGQEAQPDQVEMTNAKWLTPEEAMAASRRGELGLRFPTIKTLGAVGQYPNTTELIRSTIGREIPRIHPRIVQRDGKEVILLPDDPGYS